MPRPFNARSADGSEPGKPAERQRREERGFVTGLDHDEPARLAQVRRDLRHRLARRHAERCVETGRREHAVADLLRDVAGRSEAPERPRHLQERLVERQRLEDRRVVAGDVEHRLRRVAVGAEVDRHDNRLRAEPQRGPQAASRSARREPAPRRTPRSPRRGSAAGIRRPTGRRRRSRACRATPAFAIARRTRRTRRGRGG